MEPDRIDLSPLDAADDQLAYERLIRRVMDAAAPELARRALQSGPLAVVVGWARPAFAAAAVIAALALGAILATDRPEPTTVGVVDADALGLPAPAADWLDADREPSESDLILALERRP